MKPIAEIFEHLVAPKEVIITTHASPDADALGSSLALYHFLIHRGHQVKVISPTEYPDFLSWMPGEKAVLNYESDDRNQLNGLIEGAEIIFCLDFSGLGRTREMEGILRNAKGIKILIDHHLNPEDFAHYGVSDTSAAATAELVYDVIAAHGEPEEITKEIADCLYAGIMTDTGSFRFPSTSAKIHRTVAELIDRGANVSQISRAVYDTNSVDRMKFIGYALLKRLTVREDLNIAYFVIKAIDYKRFNLKKGDTEGLVNYALSIKGIVMATIIKEQGDEIKLSFRSVGNYAVNAFASDHFSGGGHKNASGGSSVDSLDRTVSRFEELLPDFKDKYYIQT